MGAAVDVLAMKGQADLFEAVMTGDLSLVRECVTAGCDVNELGEHGHTPLCTAIRNGEVDVACYLIPHTSILLKKIQATPASRPAALWSFLGTGQTQHLVANKIANWVLNSVIAAFDFAVSHFILNFLLVSIDTAVMSALHVTNFNIYSIIRTRLFRSGVSSLIHLVISSKSGHNENALVSGRLGTNLTVEGSTAFDLILGYGGNIEPIALQMLAHGLTFDNINHLRGPALLMWRWAAFHGHLNVIIALQKLGMDIDLVSGIALCVACHNLDYSLCNHLVNSGAAVCLRPNGENPPIVECARGARDIAATEPQHSEDALSIMEVLLNKHADVDQAGRAGRTALSICCGRQTLGRLARFLLDHGADPDTADEDGNTPLHYAAPLDTPSLVETLIAYGASPSRRNKKGELPANKAAYDGCSVETLKLLVETFDVTQSDWDSMLFAASPFGCLEMLEYLLGKGANPTIEIESESCALFKAIDRHRQAQEAITILFQKARADFTTQSGKTALHHLVTGYREPRSHTMIPLVVERGADLEALREHREHGPESSDGCSRVTPLWEACLRQDFDYPASGVDDNVRVLIELGANPWIKIESGEIISCTSQRGRIALRTQTHIEAAPKRAVECPSPERPAVDPARLPSSEFISIANDELPNL